MMSHANTTVYELMWRGFSKNTIIHKLKEGKIFLFESETYDLYKQYFKENSPAFFNKYRRYIYEYAIEID